VAKEAVSRDLVGLALSGGGIRSASFNLGVLQALDHYELLRYVDYLATVSGGGYIGARFTSAIRTRPEPGSPSERPSREGAPQPESDPEDRLLKAGPDGRQEPETKRFLEAGHFLGHLLLLANRYFIGLAKINLALGSMILMLCALVALIWRFLDETPACELILMLTGGTIYEAVRPFLFSLIFLLAWAIGWGLSSIWPRGCPRALVLGAVVELALVSATLVWRWLETSSVEVVLGSATLVWRRPDSSHPPVVGLHSNDLLWLLMRPLPFLLTLAWPLACVIVLPGPGSRGTDHGAGRGRRERSWGVVLAISLIAATVAVGWRFLEAHGLAALRAEDPWWLLLRPLPFLLAIGCPIGWWLTTKRSETPALDIGARMQWLFLLAGICFLIGSAVWLATPSISLVLPTRFTPANQNRTGLPTTVVPFLLAILVVALLPFLSPRRLLESGLRPQKFWEPWVFYIACTAAVVGVPLLGIWFFARHNISGLNAEREHKLLPYDLEWDRFWRRAKKEAKEAEASGAVLGAAGAVPGAESPAAKIWGQLRLDQRKRIEDILATKTWGQENPLLPIQFGTIQYETNEYINKYMFSEHAIGLHQLPVFQKFREAQTRIETIPDTEERERRQFPQWPDLKRLLDQEEGLSLSEAEKSPLVGKINRLFLEASYPDEVTRHTLIRRSPLIHYDQWTRSILCLGFGLVALVSAWLIRINGTSLHQFYRDQLAAVYIWHGGGGNEDPPLSGLKAGLDRGGPYHLICATFNAVNFRDLLLRLTQVAGRARPPESRPTMNDGKSATPCTPKPAQKRSVGDEILATPLPGPARDRDTFIFSHQYCGCDTTGYCRTESYRSNGEALTLSEAVALSGAAVSPSQSGNPLSLFLAVLNLRLGQWLPNPARPNLPTQPSIWQLLNDRSPGIAGRNYFFISDGGHHENLGLGVLLQRRCRLIIVSDATADRPYTFEDFLQLCRRERVDHGIRFYDALSGPGADEEEVPLDSVRPQVWRSDYKEKVPEKKGRDWLSERHFFIARISYPAPADDFGMQAKETLLAPGSEDSNGEPGEAYLVYLKPSLTGDEENDLKKHWAENPEFPHDPTANQFYDFNMVESYRQLGYHMGQELCRNLLSSESPSGFDHRRFSLIHSWIRDWIDRHRAGARDTGARGLNDSPRQVVPLSSSAPPSG
jgi:hypothetical protein